jgi:hypothetical protein
MKGRCPLCLSAGSVLACCPFQCQWGVQEGSPHSMSFQFLATSMQKHRSQLLQLRVGFLQPLQFGTRPSRCIVAYSSPNPQPHELRGSGQGRLSCFSFKVVSFPLLAARVLRSIRRNWMHSTVHCSPAQQEQTQHSDTTEILRTVCTAEFCAA